MNLKNVKFLNEFRRLPYPKNKMLIIGSGTLSLLGIRKNKDLDVWVTKDIFNKISKDKNFKPYTLASGDKGYNSSSGNIEVIDKLFNYKIEDQLKSAIIIYGIHFQSPEDIIEWKKEMGRPKDLQDIKQLEKFLQKKVVENYLRVLQTLK